MEALFNSYLNSKSNAYLDVLHCLKVLGVSLTSQSKLKLESTGLMLFFLKMRKVRKVNPVYSDKFLTLANYFSHFQPQGDNSLNKIIENEFKEVELPTYNIEARDFQNTEDPRKISEELFDYFKSPRALPLAFLTCFEDDNNNTCLSKHAITLVGVKKIFCESGIFYAGIFENSWGKKVEGGYDLIKMLQGMIKHQGGYYTVYLCEESSCLNPPIILNQRSNPIFHLTEAGDVDGIIKLKHQNFNLLSGGFTPLTFALSFGSFDTIKILIKYGADVNKPNSYGWTPYISLLIKAI